jgi:hypothetical protein
MVDERRENARKENWKRAREKGNEKRKQVHCKKRQLIFPSPAGMSQTKLSLAGNN